jgi:hypothetical protein
MRRLRSAFKESQTLSDARVRSRWRHATRRNDSGMLGGLSSYKI